MNAAPARREFRRNDLRSRGHAGYRAFIVHRVSGLALALFLPVHFLTLTQALAHPAALDRFLAWTHEPPVRLSETALVLALAVHLTGGLRLLLVEFVGWRADWQKSAIALAAGAAVGYALLFALYG